MAVRSIQPCPNAPFPPAGPQLPAFNGMRGTTCARIFATSCLHAHARAPHCKLEPETFTVVAGIKL